MTSAGYASFRSLLTWQKAQELALESVKLVRELPRDRSADALGNQLLRSAASVAANIAEGYGRYSPGSYRNHLSIARGSLFEAESWIDLLFRSGYLSPEQTAGLTGQCHEIGRLLTSAMNSIPDRTQRIREDGANYEV